MKVELDSYVDIYKKLEKHFYMLYGNGKNNGLESMKKIEHLMNSKAKQDRNHLLPRNTLIEAPNNLYKFLEKTYLGREMPEDGDKIGCTNDEEKQCDGITNMALLMYTSNHLSKKYKYRQENAETREKAKEYKSIKEGYLLDKDMAMEYLMASIYVLEKTSNDYQNFFSYGKAKDNKEKTILVVDLPYIGQICLHFGWKAKQDNILSNTEKLIKSILQEKLKLGQITPEQLQKIDADISQNGILPEYEGKLYEYLTIPLEYIGTDMKEYRKKLGNKLPEDITTEDIETLKRSGLNERELYYFFIKLGAPKKVLQQITGEREKTNKKLTPQTIKNATKNVTIQEFNHATEEIKEISKKSKVEENNIEQKNR